MTAAPSLRPGSLEAWVAALRLRLATLAHIMAARGLGGAEVGPRGRRGNPPS